MTTPGTGGPGGRPAGNANGEADSPWARPSGGSGGEPVVTWVSPQTGAPTYPTYQRPVAPPPVAQPPVAPPPPRKSSTLLWVAGGGAALVVLLVVVLVVVATGVFRGSGPSLFGADDPEPSKPPLAQLCPPLSENPAPGGSEAAPVEGPRVVDRDSGISYLKLGAPWQNWDRGPWGEGTLGVGFNTGYYFITETYSAGDYLASVLSGKVPATVGDSLTLNLPCAGRQVAEDVRRAYYPQPTVKEQTRDEQVVVGGRPAWVSTFHLSFQANGLDARGEQVAVVLVDVGRPDAAVLYISIPDTHQQYDAQIDRVIASIQPA